MVEVKGSAVVEAMSTVQQRLGEAGLHRILSELDAGARTSFAGAVVASAWFPLDHFVQFLALDVLHSDGGDETALIRRSETLIERQLRGVYKMFVRLSTPEFVLKRLSTVHAAYFRGVLAEVRSLEAGRAVIRYTGFSREHRLIGYSIIGFYRKALEISGAASVDARFSTPIDDGSGYAELIVSWS